MSKKQSGLQISVKKQQKKSHAFSCGFLNCNSSGDSELKKETKRKIRTLGMILFLIYIILLVYFLFFAESYGRAAEIDREYRYNLVPFVEIRRFWTYREQLGFLAVFTNIFGNVIGFIPLGFILPIISNCTRSGSFITVIGFTLSMCVEVIQLMTKVGSFDVDDLILNTLGAVIGYILFTVCNRLRRWIHKKRYS